MSTRAKGDVSSTRGSTPETTTTGSLQTGSRVSPRKKSATGVGAVRETNLVKSKDGSMIYRRRSSTGAAAGKSSSLPEKEKSPVPGMRKRQHEGSPALTAVRKRSSDDGPSSGSGVVKRMRTIHHTSSGQVLESDAFCWQCHKEGTADTALVCCELCPRVYHLRCLSMEEKPAPDWVCQVCEKILQAECVDTRSKAMSLISLDQLCVLLKYALQRMRHTESEDFHRPVDPGSVPHYTDYVFHPMDISTLEKNVRKKVYGSTEAFLADARYILHNCIIYNGEQSKLTSIAKMIIKICKHETSEIEICPDCYLNSCTKQQENWFCEPCRNPHTLVWAKMKGYPFWPAKALREVGNQVDVRFFGEHDRAWVPSLHCYLLSKDPPSLCKNRRGGFDKSMTELQLHIQKLTERFGHFEYAPNKMLYDADALAKSVKPKASPAKSSTSSKASSTESTPTKVKPVTMKSPEKQHSIVSKTASAVKLKYSSIISTRHTKQRGKTIGDNVPITAETKEHSDNSEMTLIDDTVSDMSPRDDSDSEMAPKDDHDSEMASKDDSDSEMAPKDDTDSEMAPKVATDSEIAPKKDTYSEMVPKDHTDSEVTPKCDTESEMTPHDPTDNETIPKGHKLSEMTTSDHKNSDEGQSTIVHKDAEQQSDEPMPKKQRVVGNEDCGDNKGHDCDSQSDQTSHVDVSCEEKAAGKSTVFLMAKDSAIEDAKTSSSITSALEIIPKVKTITKSVISTIEGKIKTLQSGLTTTEDTEASDIAKDNPVKSGETDSKVTSDTTEHSPKPCSQNPTASGSNDTDQMLTETTDVSANQDEVRHVSMETQSDVGSKKNTFLEKLVASCKEKLGVESPQALSSLSSLEAAEDIDSDESASSDDHDDVSSSSSIGSTSTNDCQKLDPTDADKTQTAITAMDTDTTETAVTITGTIKSPTAITNLGTDKSPTGNVGIEKSETAIKNVGADKSQTAITSVDADKLPTEVTTVRSDDTQVMLETGNDEDQEDDSKSRHAVIDVDQDNNNDVTAMSLDKPAASSLSPNKPSPAKLQSPTPPEIHPKTTTPTSKISQTDASPSKIDSFTGQGQSVQSRLSPGHSQPKVSPARPQTATVLPEKVVPITQSMSGTAKSLNNSMTDATQPEIPDDIASFNIMGLDLGAYMEKISKTVRGTMEDFCQDLMKTEAGSVFQKHLQLEAKRLEWRHQQELKEIRHTANLKLLEMRASMELEKDKALDKVIRDLRFKFEDEKRAAIEETKRKQWCANCGKEAIFYCCWNTSYCDYPCQQSHWPEHMSNCTQSQSTQQSADQENSQSEPRGGSASGTPSSISPPENWNLSTHKDSPGPRLDANKHVYQSPSVLNHASPTAPPYQRLNSGQVMGSHSGAGGPPMVQYLPHPTHANTPYGRANNAGPQYSLGPGAMGLHPPGAGGGGPPVIMSIRNSNASHQPQLRPIMSHNMTPGMTPQGPGAGMNPQPMLMPQTPRLHSPNMQNVIPGSTMQYRGGY